MEEALGFGWIDGQRKSYDSDFFLQKFTPRQKRSPWSKRNREHVARDPETVRRFAEHVVTFTLKALEQR